MSISPLLHQISGIYHLAFSIFASFCDLKISLKLTRTDAGLSAISRPTKTVGRPGSARTYALGVYSASRTSRWIF